MKNNKKKSRCLIITLFIMVLIFIHSAMPGDLSGMESSLFLALIRIIFPMDVTGASFIIRKSAHFLEYTLLGFSLVFMVREQGWGLSAPEKKPGGRDPESSCARSSAGSVPGSFQLAAMSWLIGTLYALTDEFHQAFVPGRSCELRDVLIDSAGAMAGVLLALFIIKLKKDRKGTER